MVNTDMCLSCGLNSPYDGSHRCSTNFTHHPPIKSCSDDQAASESQERFEMGGSCSYFDVTVVPGRIVYLQPFELSMEYLHRFQHNSKVFLHAHSFVFTDKVAAILSEICAG